MHAERIASLDDVRIRPYRDVANPAAIERAGLFVAEGRLVVRRLLASDRFRTVSILATEVALGALTPDLHDCVAPVYVVEQDAMDQIVGFNIHRGCLALAERPPVRAIDSLPLGGVKRLLLLEGVNNPDNVGGIFRSAAAFGVDAVMLGPSAGDPLYRKAIRTSMAATLQVPFVSAGAWPDALATLRAHGIHVLALTTAHDARSLGDVPRDIGRVALVVGNEAEGLSAAALAAANERVRISMTSSVDSLNVTVAASIAMHYFFSSEG
jgi:tRNA G18 (ribose-2'-O)-methylase SpoU